MSEPKQHISQNFKGVALLPLDIITRQKILNLLDVQNFDITQENLVLLDEYTYEDIQLVENLAKSKQYYNLAQLYDGAGTCINSTLNRHGKYIHKGHLARTGRIFVTSRISTKWRCQFSLSGEMFLYWAAA